MRELTKLLTVAIFSAVAVGTVLGLVLRGIVHHAEETKKRHEHAREYVA
jgi:hypothetical protein